MGSPLERRRTGGRRRSDARDIRALRGLLHDLGHEMTTLSYLVEAVRGDVSLPDDSSYRLELLSLEMTRLLDIIRHGMNGLEAAGADAEPVKVREMATQLARLAELAHPAEVRLLPGPEATAYVNAVLLWRVLSNLVDNAARAAGAEGRVTLTVRQDGATFVEVTDTGRGFGNAPTGEASLGLDVVLSLLEACGGSLAVESPPGGGTTVLVGLPGEVTAPARAGAGLGG